jgi:hypothetical protein
MGAEAVDVDCQGRSGRGKRVSSGDVGTVKYGKVVVSALLLGGVFVLTTAPCTATAPGALRSTATPRRFAVQLKNLESRMRIARADRAFQETRDAADEILDIASNLQNHVRDGGALSNSDRKSLDRLKKLAKRIRTDFGGEGQPQLDEAPASLPDLADAIGDRAKKIDFQLETVTRYEVNRKLIVLAGDLMILSDLMKSLGVRR